MKVNFITQNTNLKNLKYYNNSNKQTLSQNKVTNNVTPMIVQSNSSYGKMLAFGMKQAGSASSVALMKTKLIDFVTKKCQPFLANTQAFRDKNHQLNTTANNMVDLYFRKIICGGNNFDILSLEAHKGYAKVGKYLKNIEEYNYLKQKSQERFGSETSRQYASDIAQTFQPVQFMEDYRPVIITLKNIEKTIKNGIAGLKPKQNASEISKKRDNIKEADSLTLFNQYYITNVSLFNDNFQEALAKQSSLSKQDVMEYGESIPRIMQDITKHQELTPKLEERTLQAESLIQENSFTEADIQKAIDAFNLKKQGIIKRNLKAFNQNLDNHPKHKWNDALNVQADEVLQKQSDANKKLWELLEADKKEYFSEENIACREKALDDEVFSWAMGQPHTDTFSDDLPF